MPETILGVDKTVLLWAIMIVDSGLLVGDLGTDEDLAIVQASCYEHAFAEWLRCRGCFIGSTIDLTTVSNNIRIIDHESTATIVSQNPHYLSALAQAVCKVGD